MVFLTETGEIYLLETAKKEVMGGTVTKEKYISVRAVIGEEGEIVLKDGRTIRTSKIIKYI